MRRMATRLADPPVRRRGGARALTPVEQERQRRRADTRARIDRRFLQPAKTIIAATVWLGISPLYISTIAPYVSYWYASLLLPGLVVASAVLLHLWPSRTPPWRSLVWCFFLMGAVGSLLLQMGAGTMALTAAALAGTTFMGLRINQNGRKLWHMVQDWRAFR